MVLRFQQYFVRQCATKKVPSTLNNKQNNQISETNQRITALQELRLRSELASCNYFCYYCFHIVYNIHSLVEAKLLSYCTLAPGLKRPSRDKEGTEQTLSPGQDGTAAHVTSQDLWLPAKVYARSPHSTFHCGEGEAQESPPLLWNFTQLMGSQR